MKKKNLLVVEKWDNLTEEHKMFMFQSYGHGVALGNIKERLVAKFKIDVTEDTINNLCTQEDNRVYVDRYQQEYMARTKDVPLANKRVRLDEYQMMRDRLVEIAHDLDASTKSGRQEILMVFKRLNELLCAAREEMEGKPSHQNFINITELSNLSDEELQRRKEVLIAKALGTYSEGNIRIREAGQGAEATDSTEPIEVPLAAPKEL